MSTLGKLLSPAFFLSLPMKLKLMVSKKVGKKLQSAHIGRANNTDSEERKKRFSVAKCKKCALILEG